MKNEILTSVSNQFQDSVIYSSCVFQLSDGPILGGVYVDVRPNSIALGMTSFALYTPLISEHFGYQSPFFRGEGRSSPNSIPRAGIREELIDTAVGVLTQEFKNVERAASPSHVAELLDHEKTSFEWQGQKFPAKPKSLNPVSRLVYLGALILSNKLQKAESFIKLVHQGSFVSTDVDYQEFNGLTDALENSTSNAIELIDRWSKAGYERIQNR
ncbi:MAG: hypothetical protein AAF542_25365 [Pseudomonadota bacterium]